MTHPYQSFVTEFARNLTRARQFPLGGFQPSPCPPLSPEAPRTLVFSPHPDDEAITGALPLRLRREAGHRVIVVAVTLGSKVERQAERLAEMRGACEFLGFELLNTSDQGLRGISPEVRLADVAAWAASVVIAARIILEHRPSVIVFPHELDGHSTHQGTHLLVLDALHHIGPDFACQLVLTEFWAALADPNLMVESSPGDVGDLMAAISFHKGEVLRNPYHVLLPSWLSDNVRRGSERVGGQGGSAANFTFATLYKVVRWEGQGLTCAWQGGRSLPAASEPAAIFG
jgi:LmbE family N-acetylglucosaminyl deacetylase